MTDPPYNHEEHDGWGATDTETLRRLEEGERPGINLEAVLSGLAGSAIFLLFLAVIIVAGARLIDFISGLS